MAFQSVPESCEVSLNYLQNGVPMQMTFGARKLGGYSLAQMQQLAASVDSQVASLFRPIQTQDCAYVKTEVRGLESLNDLLTEANTNAGAGGQAVSGLPNNVTIAIKKTSSDTGRSARGRVYWIGLTRNDLQADENFITLGANAAIVTAIDGVRTACIAQGWVPVIVSRFSQGVKRSVGVTFEWLQTSNDDLRVDSQRGRLP